MVCCALLFTDGKRILAGPIPWNYSFRGRDRPAGPTVIRRDTAPTGIGTRSCGKVITR